jgi:hypothetical protein
MDLSDAFRLTNASCCLLWIASGLFSFSSKPRDQYQGRHTARLPAPICLDLLAQDKLAIGLLGRRAELKLSSLLDVVIRVTLELCDPGTSPSNDFNYCSFIIRYSQPLAHQVHRKPQDSYQYEDHLHPHCLRGCCHRCPNCQPGGCPCC